MWNPFKRKPRCCECDARDGRAVIQWCVDWKGYSTHVCMACAWEWRYPEFCYESCKMR